MLLQKYFRSGSRSLRPTAVTSPLCTKAVIRAEGANERRMIAVNFRKSWIQSERVVYITTLKQLGVCAIVSTMHARSTAA